MQQAVQFETVIESGMIRIPEQYVKSFPMGVKVTLTPVGEHRIKAGIKSKACALSHNDFSALKIDTQSFKFNREEANERY